MGVRLTNHGEALVADARRIVSLADEVYGRTVDPTSASIRLGCSPNAAGGYLADFLSDWIPNHPSIHLTVVEDGAHRMIRRLDDAECDAAIVAAPVPDRFDSLPISTGCLRAVLPRQHELAQEPGPLDITQLHRERVLMNGPSFLSADLFLAACRLHGIEPDIVYECSVGQTLAALAEAGLGVAVMSDNVDLRGFTLPERSLCDPHGHPLQYELRIAWDRNRGSRVVPEFAQRLSAFVRGRA